ncbi:ribonuclease H-like protein [Apiospora arundinis]
MIVPRTFCLGSRRSALRNWSPAIQERKVTVFHRRVGTKATAAPARPATARVPMTAATALQSSQSSLGKTFFVDTPAGVSEVADHLWAQAPSGDLYVDLEGAPLSRYGSISLLTIYSPRLRQAFRLDVFTLEWDAFKTTGSRGFNIKQILESNTYTKVFFDIRNDSNVLFYHFRVTLRNVEDIQLMKNVTRSDGRSRHNFPGLAKCLKTVLSSREKKGWDKSKGVVNSLFCPKSGVSYVVFKKRPLSPEILAYCVSDVYYLPRLKEKYWNELSETWRGRVMEDSKAQWLQASALKEVKKTAHI